MKWRPGALLGPSSTLLLEKLSSHYTSFDESTCKKTARQIWLTSQDASIEEQCRRATRHFARRAARDGALLTLVPLPLRMLIDYSRTSKHVANMTATTLLLRNEHLELERVSPRAIRDVLLGERSASEPKRDFSLLGTYAVTKLAAHRSKPIIRRLLVKGPFNRWMLRPFAGPIAAAACNYGEIWIAGRVVEPNDGEGRSVPRIGPPIELGSRRVSAARNDA